MLFRPFLKFKKLSIRQNQNTGSGNGELSSIMTFTPTGVDTPIKLMDNQKTAMSQSYQNTFFLKTKILRFP